MSAGDIKLRAVIVWMAVMLAAVSLPLAHVWKQQAYVRLSRELAQTVKDRDALANEVLRLETETRGLRQYSRIEAVARRRLGLIDPGPPMVIQPAGQVLASRETRGDDAEDGSGQGGNKVAKEGGDGIQAARWKGLFR